MTETISPELKKVIKETISENTRAINENNFQRCSTEQVVRNKKTGAVFSVIFDHGMGQYKFTPMTRSTRGVHYRNNLDGMELARTGKAQKEYTSAVI